MFYRYEVIAGNKTGLRFPFRVFFCDKLCLEKSFVKRLHTHWNPPGFLFCLPVARAADIHLIREIFATGSFVPGIADCFRCVKHTFVSLPAKGPCCSRNIRTKDFIHNLFMFSIILGT